MCIVVVDVVVHDMTQATTLSIAGRLEAVAVAVVVAADADSICHHHPT